MLAEDPTAMETVLSAEEKLCAAILEDALAVLYGTARFQVSNFQRRSDIEWFMKEDFDYVFSCANVCEALGIDHAALKTAVIRMVTGPSKLAGRAWQPRKRSYYRRNTARIADVAQSP